MDRIQKALDKAREKHAQQPLVKKNNVNESVRGTGADHAEDPLADNTLESISYSQTKVIDVPNSTLEKNRIIAGFYNNPQSAVFRMLRTQVLKKMRSNRWQTLAVTSPLRVRVSRSLRQIWPSRLQWN